MMLSFKMKKMCGFVEKIVGLVGDVFLMFFLIRYSGDLFFLFSSKGKKKCNILLLLFLIYFFRKNL